jgi:hypothetical protein
VLRFVTSMPCLPAWCCCREWLASCGVCSGMSLRNPRGVARGLGVPR